MEDEHENSLLNSSGRHRFPSMSLSCCFGGGGGGRHRVGRSLDFDAFSLSPAATTTPSKPATTTDHLPESKGMYTPFKSRKGRNRRNSSADYSYDPESYALNFEDPSETEGPINSFTSRLPLSPPRRGRAAPETMSSSEQKIFARAEAVAEVKKNLDFTTSMAELKTRGVDLPTPQRARW